MREKEYGFFPPSDPCAVDGVPVLAPSGAVLFPLQAANTEIIIAHANTIKPTRFPTFLPPFIMFADPEI
jgi:hypothetical protein